MRQCAWKHQVNSSGSDDYASSEMGWWDVCGRMQLDERFPSFQVVSHLCVAALQIVVKAPQALETEKALLSKAEGEG